MPLLPPLARLLPASPEPLPPAAYPLPQTPFPAPAHEPTGPLQASPLPAYDWQQDRKPSKSDYFNSVDYFVSCFGMLPWVRLFDLNEKKLHTELLAELATRYDLARITVAHLEYFERQDEPVEYPHTVLLLDTHLLLEIKLQYNSRGHSATFNCGASITLYYSSATDAARLDDITRLLHRLLPVPPPAVERIYALM